MHPSIHYPSEILTKLHANAEQVPTPKIVFTRYPQFLLPRAARSGNVVVVDHRRVYVGRARTRYRLSGCSLCISSWTGPLDSSVGVFVVVIGVRGKIGARLFRGDIDHFFVELSLFFFFLFFLVFVFFTCFPHHGPPLLFQPLW